jgi:hypothetical protein
VVGGILPTVTAWEPPTDECARCGRKMPPPDTPGMGVWRWRGDDVLGELVCQDCETPEEASEFIGAIDARLSELRSAE